MDDTSAEVIGIFKETGALLEGHFLLRSGLHSRHFFQCAQVCQHLDKVERLAALMIAKVGAPDFDTVVAPAMGGLVIGQEFARQTRKRFIFLEKVEGHLELRRGFKIQPGEKVFIVEDVITRGGRVAESIAILKALQADIRGVAVLVDRSEGQARFEVPHHPLITMSFPTYAPDGLPEDLARSKAIKPGS